MQNNTTQPMKTEKQIAASAAEFERIIMMDTILLGKRLKQVRKKLGIRQTELAMAIQSTQPAISRLEKGEETYSSTIIGVLKFYGNIISLDYLFSEDFDVESDQLFYYIRKRALQKLHNEISMISDSIDAFKEALNKQMEAEK